MIIGWFFCSLALAVWVNGMADNLPHHHVSLREMESWVLPRCGYCDRVRKFSDWAPAFSLLLRGGRCAHCGAPRPIRDHIVEAALMLAIPGMWLAGWLPGSVTEVWLQALMLSACLLMIVIDFEHRLVLVEIVSTASLVVLAAAALGGWEWFLQTVEGGLAGFAGLLLLYGFGQLAAWIFRLGVGSEPLGFGDVWIAGFVGLLVGWPSILPTLFLAIFLGGAAGILLMVSRFFRRESILGVTMAYGPYLILAGLFIRWFGGSVVETFHF